MRKGKLIFRICLEERFTRQVVLRIVVPVRACPGNISLYHGCYYLIKVSGGILEGCIFTGD